MSQNIETSSCQETPISDQMTGFVGSNQSASTNIELQRQTEQLCSSVSHTVENDLSDNDTVYVTTEDDGVGGTVTFVQNIKGENITNEGHIGQTEYVIEDDLQTTTTQIDNGKLYHFLIHCSFKPYYSILLALVVERRLIWIYYSIISDHNVETTDNQHHLPASTDIEIKSDQQPKLIQYATLTGASSLLQLAQVGTNLNRDSLVPIKTSVSLQKSGVKESEQQGKELVKDDNHDTETIFISQDQTVEIPGQNVTYVLITTAQNEQQLVPVSKITSDIGQ